MIPIWLGGGGRDFAAIGQSRLIRQQKKDFATNYANYAKTTTARQVNNEEDTNSAKTAKKRGRASFLFSHSGCFLLLLLLRNRLLFLRCFRVISEIRGLVHRPRRRGRKKRFFLCCGFFFAPQGR
jgi:hypothetical protein